MDLTEQILRWLSATVLTAAAVLSTVSWRRWSHPLIKPGMAYTATILWIIGLYRWALAVSAIEAGSEWGPFIRVFVNVAFMAMGLGFVIHAVATREFKRRNFRLYRGSD